MNKSIENRAKLLFVLSMVIFGTIGIFRRYITLPSGMIALSRAVIGMLFQLLVITVTHRKISIKAIRQNLPVLCASGAIMGFNWILLFEAYQYTSVATATLCYYMAPVFVILASAALFKERLTFRKLLCCGIAVVGMVLVSGVLQTGLSGMAELKGIVLGLGAAALYASVILLNKKLKEIEAYDKTIMQLAASAVVILPYTLRTEALGGIEFTPLMISMMLIVGIVHTGIAYVLYFGALGNLKAQSIALYSYLDPIIAVILSALLLKEEMGITGIVGAVLILGATMLSERAEA